MPQPVPAPKTYYDTLGVKSTASVQDIRRAYRDLSKLYHPDTTALPATVATEKFQRLNEAYATLSSPERRLAYDQKVGYSRLPVMQAPAHLNKPVSQRPPAYSKSAYLEPTDRPLSAGEVFALFILGVTFVACLVLVVAIGVTQGEIAFTPFSPPAGPEITHPEAAAPPQRQASPEQPEASPSPPPTASEGAASEGTDLESDIPRPPSRPDMRSVSPRWL
ncbi:Chaperone protein DnaJ [Halomicronema hongdechloris C2206]|uniref:Chaperone protein DnaJ n=1 Tax=Halomicronema hongdechloris C2206 TaxID=1641165 RepID=A0A1Z3HSD2_9CYAN|nr:J domain-containing protein [Halomicronema hongdechloris]ASC73209.1 Chaperone protein DnaJ [Halomicronema hongdechloris C2206]